MQVVVISRAYLVRREEHDFHVAFQRSQTNIRNDDLVFVASMLVLNSNQASEHASTCGRSPHLASVRLQLIVLPQLEFSQRAIVVADGEEQIASIAVANTCGAKASITSNRSFITHWQSP